MPCLNTPGFPKMLGSADETGSRASFALSFTVFIEHCWVSIAELRIQKRGHDSREITTRYVGSVGLSCAGEALGRMPRRRRGSEAEERLLGPSTGEQHVQRLVVLQVCSQTSSSASSGNLLKILKLWERDQQSILSILSNPADDSDTP